MTNGVISLRCPKCTRPFLSLQQQAGSLVTCPHCAQSAPAAAFPPAGSGPLHATALPVRRRLATLRPELQSQLAPPPGFGFPASAVAPPLPVTPPMPSAAPHPPFPSGATMARPTGQVRWPPAPEQPPMFTPPILPEDLPPEPDAPWVPAPPAYTYGQPVSAPSNGAPLHSPFGVAGGLPLRVTPTVPLANAAFPFQTPVSPFQAQGAVPAPGPGAGHASAAGLPPLGGPFAPVASPFQPAAFPGEVPPLRPSAADQAAPPSFQLPGDRALGGARGGVPPAPAPLNQNPPAHWRPPARHRSMAPAVLLLILVVGACLWVLRDDLLPALHVDIPAPSAPQTPAPRAPATTTPAPVTGNEAPDAGADPLTPAGPVATVMPGREKAAVPQSPVHETPPEPEIRRAELPLIPAEPDADLSRDERQEVTEAAGTVLDALFLPDTQPEARRALILQPEVQAAAMDKFFRPAGQAAAPPKLVSVRPLAATPLSLPGLRPTAMFQVTTSANPSGALARLARPVEGGTGSPYRLDWLLFQETHDRHLAAFLAAPAAGESEKPKSVWFHVILRRTHALDLPADVRETHVLFDAQASPDTSVRAVMAAPKETPAGRALEAEAKWGKVYLARLLLQHSILRPGVPLIVILDIDKAGEGD